MTKQDFLDLFAGAKDIKAKAALYRKLALQHHPDRGGSTEDMQMLNRAYEDVRAGFDRKNDEEAIKEDVLTPAADLLRELGLSYEITGLWIWVDADERTRAVKAALMAGGFRWAGKKKRWYYAGVPASGRGADMNYIRQKYGSKVVSNTRRDDDQLSA